LRKNRVTFWAWTASIGVHLIVLTAFGVVRFSRSQAPQERTAPTAQVSRIKRLMQAAPVIPKPKVKRTVRKYPVRTSHKPFSASQILDTAPPTSDDSATSANSTASHDTFSPPGAWESPPIRPNKIKFFSSTSSQRKVCYLVDCSGSMQGIFARVRKELKQSIGGLQLDQFFYIIFFGADKLFESGDGRMFRATAKQKSAAYDFIDSIRPAGKTNALTALERGLQIRDGSGAAPSVIYFLTDGFELTNADLSRGGGPRFAQKIVNLQRRFAPKTVINTIGFWPQNSDRMMLEMIATQTKGQFVSVTQKNSKKNGILQVLGNPTSQREDD